jgi:hypothetical protein
LSPDLSAKPDDETQVEMLLADPEGTATGDDLPGSAKSVIGELVNQINALMRLRWGRVYSGLSVQSIESIDANGKRTTYVFPPSATMYITFDELIQLCKAQGLPEPKPPFGLRDAEGIDLVAVAKLSAGDPDVARALRLVDLALGVERQGILDWTAAYSSWEVVREDTTAQGQDPLKLGFWTDAERRAFTGTANSVHVLGERARHGKAYPKPKSEMKDEEAAWFVRGVVARWLTWRLKLASARL